MPATVGTVSKVVEIAPIQSENLSRDSLRNCVAHVDHSLALLYSKKYSFKYAFDQVACFPVRLVQRKLLTMASQLILEDYRSLPTTHVQFSVPVGLQRHVITS